MELTRGDAVQETRNPVGRMSTQISKGRISRDQREGQMFWKPGKGKIVTSWRNEGRFPGEGGI